MEQDILRSLDAQAKATTELVSASETLLGRISTDIAKRTERAEAQLAARRQQMSPDERRLTKPVEDRLGRKQLGELRRQALAETAAEREKQLQVLQDKKARLQALEPLLSSPGSYLNHKAGLGPERAHLAVLVQHASHPELIAYRDRALAEGNLQLAAALNSRVAQMPAKDRPFDPSTLTDRLVGEEYAQQKAQLDDAIRSLDQAMLAHARFETGRGQTAVEAIEAGLQQRQNTTPEQAQIAAAMAKNRGRA